jgi:UDP-N-acetylmuramyl pentapeptide phosphotransferase/UDP-N-acetylglucosamine-1-phosphate transferase
LRFFVFRFPHSARNLFSAVGQIRRKKIINRPKQAGKGHKKQKKTPIIGGAIFLSPRDVLVVLVSISLIYFVHWNIISIAKKMVFVNVEKFW